METSLRVFKERFVLPHVTYHQKGGKTHTLNGASSVAFKIHKEEVKDSFFVGSSDTLFSALEGLCNFADEVGCSTISGNGLWIEGVNDAKQAKNSKGKMVWINSPCMTVDKVRANLISMMNKGAEAYFGRFDCPTVRIPSKVNSGSGRVLTKAGKTAQTAKASFLARME